MAEPFLFVWWSGEETTSLNGGLASHGPRNLFLDIPQGPVKGVAMLRIAEVNISVSIRWQCRPQANARLPTTSLFGKLRLPTTRHDFGCWRHVGRSRLLGVPTSVSSTINCSKACKEDLLLMCGKPALSC